MFTNLDQAIPQREIACVPGGGEVVAGARQDQPEDTGRFTDRLKLPAGGCRLAGRRQDDLRTTHASAILVDDPPCEYQLTGQGRQEEGKDTRDQPHRSHLESLTSL